ncbi:MAG: LamG-like jellyroll fold domain-containing protein [Candidatus Celaenobacter polaris]|nr:LamG-like jellyroll fold domain-containing protein [Candidatus Celaenobacter polaris]
MIILLAVIVAVATVTLSVERKAEIIPEKIAENEVRSNLMNLGAYALGYAIKQIRADSITSDTTTSFDDFIVLTDGRINSIKYDFDSDKDTIRIVANVSYGTAHHQSEATLASISIIDLHPEEQVGCWNFDEGSGTTAADSSDSGNDGTLGEGDAASDWTTDTAYGAGALDFDGDNDYVDLYTSVSSTYTNNFTVAAWVKPDLTWDWGLIAAEEGSWLLRSRVTKGYSYWWFGWHHVPAKVKFVFNIITDSGFPSVSIQKTENDMTINDWHYIVATYNHDYSPTQAEISIQIADEASKPGNNPSDWKATDYISKVTREQGNSTFIGGWHDIDTQWTHSEWLNGIINAILQSLASFDGKIDEVMLLKRVMTYDEILELQQFNGLNKTKTKIIYWQE